MWCIEQVNPSDLLLILSLWVAYKTLNPALTRPFINCRLHGTETWQSPRGKTRCQRQACEQMVTWPKLPEHHRIYFSFPKLYSTTDSFCPPSTQPPGYKKGWEESERKSQKKNKSVLLAEEEIKLCERRQRWHIWQVFTSLRLFCVAHIMEQNTNWASVALWPGLLVNVTGFGDANGHIVCPPPPQKPVIW